MSLDFLPFEDGQVITASDLNALVQSIQDGTIFLSTTIISGQLQTMSTSIINLDTRVGYLESLMAQLPIREQFSLTAAQGTINLSKAPLLDSELVFLNGLSLSKSGVPVGFVGDYSVSGSSIVLDAELSSQVIDGDMLVIQYRYEV